MYTIPKSIDIGGQSFPIREAGDFRMVLDCFSALEDAELTKQERILASLVIFYDGMEDVSDIGVFPSLEEAVIGMFRFFNCGEAEERWGKSPGLNRKLVDWEGDSQMIASAVNKVSGKEIREEEYIHWWTFMGYYMAIGESLFSTVLRIRDKISRGKKLEKYEREFRRENPKYFVWNSQTVEQKEAEDWLKSVWNKE